MPRQTYKFRLFPTDAQEKLLNATLSTCCDVYNSFIHWRRHDFEIFKTTPSRFDQEKALPLWKKTHPELRNISAQSLQDVCKRVHLAYEAYFDRLADYKLRKAQRRLKIINGELEKCPGPPRFKGKGSYDSLTFPQEGAKGCFKVGENFVFVAKIGSIKAVVHRAIVGTANTCIVR